MGPVVGYSRAVRIGSLIEVAGTTAALLDGGAVGGDDIAEQTREATRRVVAALAEVGAWPEDVIRTRMFDAEIDRWKVIGRAHGEVLATIRLVSAMVEVTRLIAPDLLVEIEATALVDDDR